MVITSRANVLCVLVFLKNKNLLTYKKWPELHYENKEV
jgi:hypothetical protein